MTSITIFTSDHLLAAAASAAFILALWEKVSGWMSRQQERERIESLKVDDGIQRLESITLAAQRATDEILTVLKGRKPTPLDPRPSPGLVDVVMSQGDKLGEHSLILQKLQPNGGNTNNTGDLILKLARQAGVTEESK